MDEIRSTASERIKNDKYEAKLQANYGFWQASTSLFIDANKNISANVFGGAGLTYGLLNGKVGVGASANINKKPDLKVYFQANISGQKSKISQDIIDLKAGTKVGIQVNSIPQVVNFPNAVPGFNIPISMVPSSLYQTTLTPFLELTGWIPELVKATPLLDTLEIDESGYTAHGTGYDTPSELNGAMPPSFREAELASMDALKDLQDGMTGGKFPGKDQDDQEMAQPSPTGSTKDPNAANRNGNSSFGAGGYVSEAAQAEKARRDAAIDTMRDRDRDRSRE